MPKIGRESKKVVFFGIEDIRLETAGVTRPEKGDLLIRNKNSFFCGTDVKIIKNGYFRIRDGQPRVLGHELSGVIEMVGAEVRDFREGDAVLVAPNLGCGNCEICREGNDHLCNQYEAIGITLDGGFADHTLVPERFVQAGNVIPLPEGYSFEEAALIEPISCCFNGVKALDPSPEDRVLIMGAGPIGAFHALLMRAIGVEQVFICDLLGERVEKLSFLPGVRRFCNRDINMIEHCRDMTGGRLFDVVITANPAPQSQQIALQIAGIHGRINLFGSVSKGIRAVELDTNQIHYKELTVVGTTRSTVSHFHEVIRLLAETDMRKYLSHWVSASYLLTQFQKAYEAAQDPRNLKIGFRFDE